MLYDSFYIANEFGKIGINPEGGYVTSWIARLADTHVSLLYEGSSIRRGGIPILFPYFGKSHRWPQHGFGRDVVWDVLEQHTTQAHMILDSRTHGSQIPEWYPYDFLGHIKVQISDSGALIYTLMVENRGELALPISPGLHPYWNLIHERKSHMRIDSLSGFDASSIDWTHAPPDTAFDFSGPVSINLGDYTIVIEDLSDPSVIHHLVVWSLTPVRDPDFNFVCVEPITGYNYAIDTQPISVSPHSTWTLCVRFSPQAL